MKLLLLHNVLQLLLVEGSIIIRLLLLTVDLGGLDQGARCHHCSDNVVCYCLLRGLSGLLDDLVRLKIEC